MAFAQKPVDISKEHYNFWQRQQGAVGVYYEDPLLRSTSANPQVPSFTPMAADPTYEKPRPDEHEYHSHPKFHYGKLQSDRPETEILPQNNQFLISRVGMWSELNGTPHPGYYLSKK
mgnify:CR=1 FL=1